VTADYEKISFFCAMLDVQLSILGPSGGLRVGLSDLEEKKSKVKHRTLHV
jgi:hypothetical protein